MRLTAMRAALWTMFALLLAFAGFRLLWACDFGAPSLLSLGLKYCPAPVDYALLRGLGEARRELESQIHDYELKIAEAPNCAPPTPISTPSPTPTSTPTPTPTPSPSPTDQSLRVPTELKDLKGCWVSDRGDIPLQSVITHRFTGKARFCYCFGDDGSGTLKYKKTNGWTCEGPITAELKDGALRIDQPNMNCNGDGLIDHITTCKPNASGRAVCSGQSREYPNERTGTEGYHRADRGLCD